MTIQPNSWMAEQSRLARSTYLIFDPEFERETRQRSEEHTSELQSQP